jgi:RHS repeat-associated protein
MPAGGGSAVTTSYLWCGSRICQARDDTDVVTREYYAEGELVPGTPAQPYYYGIDQLGSVRRVFVSTTNAPAYDYDPYGNPLQETAPLSDFGYAGMFTDNDSGLYLTQYRAYDPVAGRWISRDPIGESGGLVADLYLYVGGNPINLLDPLGLCPPGTQPNPSTGLAPDPERAVGAPGAEGVGNPGGACGFFCAMLGGPVQITDATGNVIGSYNHQMFNFGMQIAGTAAGVLDAVAISELSGVSGGPLLLPSGPIFGRPRAGGTSIFNLNSNSNLRIGWGWRGTGTDGVNVFRISGRWLDSVTGVKNSHVDILTFGGQK